MKVILATMALLLATPAVAEPNLYFDYLHRKNVEKQAKEKTAVDRILKQAELCEKIGGASVGFKADDVVKSCWGKPYKISTKITADAKRERWLYQLGFLELTNDVVTVMHFY